ncbi:hypothetical protein P7K49_014939 [Saguinus oedipus]|uniref:Uncharacterized protein n=1 Tax=Saguinus oedipus TaxID=9490 RepID=A0ABQ9V7V5_SAGOE|nr:hypothetical protein P7K49_014939 [Saguinus oedipus]
MKVANAGLLLRLSKGTHPLFLPGQLLGVSTTALHGLVNQTFVIYRVALGKCFEDELRAESPSSSILPPEDIATLEQCDEEQWQSATLYQPPCCTNRHPAPAPTLHQPPPYTNPHPVPAPTLHQPPPCTSPHPTPTPTLHQPRPCTNPHLTPAPTLHQPPPYTNPHPAPAPTLHPPIPATECLPRNSLRGTSSSAP